MRNWEIIRREVKLVLSGKEDRILTRRKLSIPRSTWNRWINIAIKRGVDKLVDHRHGNNHRLAKISQEAIKEAKRNGPWRSARHIRDKLNLSVDPKTIEYTLKKANLWQVNIERLKPLQRFVARHPNDLWQTDIMGRMMFPKIERPAHLIAELDDCSRFILSSGWYKKQNKFNVFSVFYAGIAHWGKPKRSLQDKGSQYRVTGLKGEADYSAYCRPLGIKLTFAPRAQTKGKIERFWRFVQRDFVRENMDVISSIDLNQRWNRWVSWYNFKFKRTFLKNQTSWEVYRKIPAIKLTRKELKELIEKLTLMVRRKVSRESTVSVAGQIYPVPFGYLDILEPESGLKYLATNSILSQWEKSFGNKD